MNPTMMLVRADPGRGLRPRCRPLLTMATAIWNNWHIGAPVKRYLNAFDC